MVDFLKKTFEVTVSVERAFKDADGKMHVVACASDSMRDRAGDRMSGKAIESMVKQAKDGAIPLLDNHRSTFSFGKSVDAWTEQVRVEGVTVKRFLVEFELDERYPQAHDLYNEIADGGTDKQLSIGGFVDKNSKTAVRREVVGKTVTRVIDEIYLDHVATTRKGHACVPRTGFMDAMVKDIFGDEDDLPNEWKSDVGEQIQDAVNKGDASGVVHTPEGALNFELVGKDDKSKTIVVLIDRSNLTDGSAKVQTNKQPNEVVPTAKSEEEDMADTTPSTQKTNEPTEAEQDVAAGLNLLATVGKTFRENSKAKEAAAAAAAAATTEAEVETPAAEAEVENKDAEGAAPAETAAATEAATEETLETVLAKAAEGMSGAESVEKSREIALGLHSSLSRLLDIEVGSLEKSADEGEPTEAAPAATVDTDEIFKSIDEKIASAIEAATTAAIEKISGEATLATVEETFKSSFASLTTELAKGLIDMAEGFKSLLNDELEKVATKIGDLEKSSDARLARLEQGAGVRQSAGDTDAALATGAEAPAPVTKSMAPTSATNSRGSSTNAFKGMFDEVRAQAMARQR